MEMGAYICIYMLTKGHGRGWTYSKTYVWVRERLSCRAVRMERKGLSFSEGLCWKEWARKQKQKNVAIEPGSRTNRRGEHNQHRNCTGKINCSTMTEVAWKTKKGRSLGSLKLGLKIPVASLELYVLSSFFVKTFITWLCIQSGLKMPHFLIKCMWPENIFYWNEVLFPSLFFLSFIFFSINWCRNCLT